MGLRCPVLHPPCSSMSGHSPAQCSQRAMEMKSRWAAVQKHWVQLPGLALQAICLTGNESFLPGQGEHEGRVSFCVLWAFWLPCPAVLQGSIRALSNLSPNALCCPHSFPHPHKYRSATSQHWEHRGSRDVTAAVTLPPTSFGTLGWRWGRGGCGDAALSVPTHSGSGDADCNFPLHFW